VNTNLHLVVVSCLRHWIGDLVCNPLWIKLSSISKCSLDLIYQSLLLCLWENAPLNSSCKVGGDNVPNGARSNNTVTYCMGLSNVVIFELLGQNTTTDPFPHTSSLSIPVCIFWSIIRHNFYTYKLTEQNCRNQRSHLAFTKIAREYKLPDSRILVKVQTPIEV